MEYTAVAAMDTVDDATRNWPTAAAWACDLLCNPTFDAINCLADWVASS